MFDEIEDFVLHREMGCTREDLVRWLPGATRLAPFRIGVDSATVHAAGGIIEILFQQAPPRTIGLVSIPVLNVTLRFQGVEAPARREFMAYFDLYTKRGGG